MATTTPDVMSDFDAWARVAARLMKRSPEQRHDILVELELDHIWQRADAKWSQRITDAIIDDDLSLADRYGRACAEEIEHRRAETETAATEAQPPAAIGTTLAAISFKPNVAPLPLAATTMASTRPRDPAVPFSGSAVAPRPHNPDDGSLPPHESGTAALSGGLLAKQTAAANRFDAASSTPRLTVQQYAKLCARLVEQPRFAGVIYADYGITSQAIYDEIDVHWRRELAENAETKKLFDMLFDYLRNQIRNQGTP